MTASASSAASPRASASSSSSNSSRAARSTPSTSSRTRSREHLCTAHDRAEAPRRRELSRLQKAETRLNHQLYLIYQDRLAEVITVDEYRAHRSRLAAELASVRQRIADLGETNAAAKEEGSTILELLKGFRETYVRADTECKARILNVVLDHVELKGKDGAESHFVFRPPFDLMFEVGEYVRKASCSKNGEWGPKLLAYLNAIRHIDLTRQIESLGQLIKGYNPNLCPAGGVA